MANTDFQENSATESVANPAWVPGPDVLHHCGLPLPPAREFFVAAPAEIGEVLTASSSMKLGKRPMPIVSRLLLCGMIGSIGWAVAHFAITTLGPLPEWLAGGTLAALTFVVTRFRQTCNYVGNLGVARYTCSGRRDRIVRAQVFLFETADELRTVQTPLYSHGVYAGTQYAFTWRDAEGRPRFRLAGSYRGENTPPKPSSPFHFAEAAEAAWSQYRLERALAELDQLGFIRFNLAGNDWLALGAGFLEFHIKGQDARCDAVDLAGVSIKAGVFEVRRGDAKVGWFSQSGVFRFEYAKMGNARVFAMTLPMVLGIPIT